MSEMEDRLEKMKARREHYIVARYEKAVINSEIRDNWESIFQTIILPTVKRVCEEFASSFGFPIRQCYEDATGLFKAFRNGKPILGKYVIYYDSSPVREKAVQDYIKRLHTRRGIHIHEIRIEPWIGSVNIRVFKPSMAIGRDISSLSTHIRDFDTPVTASSVEKVLLNALEKACKPYIEDEWSKYVD